MTSPRILTATAALLMTSTALYADVTAEDVWEDWKGWMEAYEGDVTIGSESRDGDTLTVENTAMMLPFPDGEISIVLDAMQFTENGDGSVSITMSEDYTMRISAKSDVGEDVDMKMRLTHQNMDMRASGEPDNLTYDFSADQYGVVLDEILADGVAQPFEMSFLLNNVTGTYLMAEAEQKTITYDMTANTATMKVVGSEVGSPAEAEVNALISDLSMSGTSMVPEGGMSSNPADVFSAGLMGDGGYEYSAATIDFDMVEGASSTTGKVTTGGGALKVGMVDDGLSYSGTTSDIAMDLSVSDLPFPLSFAMQEYGFDMRMPLAQTDDPADFALALNLSDFTMSDSLWNMFDPGTMLPRDPATVALDISAKAKWLFDLMDPEQAAAMEEAEVAGELYEMTLNDLTVDLAGAKLTGTGAFEFDNTDLQTFDGLPRPEGALDLKLSGANGLIDTLIQIGLLPEEQAMGARMMLGLFATPTGEDELSSKIEVNELGQVLANGQRLR